MNNMPLRTLNHIKVILDAKVFLLTEACGLVFCDVMILLTEGLVMVNEQCFTVLQSSANIFGFDPYNDLSDGCCF